MNIEAKARWDSLSPKRQVAVAAIMDDLMLAMESDGAAVLVVDRTGTGQASLLHVGAPERVAALMCAGVEALGAYITTVPEGATLQ